MPTDETKTISTHTLHSQDGNHDLIIRVFADNSILVKRGDDTIVLTARDLRAINALQTAYQSKDHQ